jgi:hypothetical protein
MLGYKQSLGKAMMGYKLPLGKHTLGTGKVAMMVPTAKKVEDALVRKVSGGLERNVLKR